MYMTAASYTVGASLVEVAGDTPPELAGRPGPAAVGVGLSSGSAAAAAEGPATRG